MSLQIPDIRRQFPFLDAASGAPIYLDNAATTQKPRAVIDAMTQAMERATGNVHRGQHAETEIATQAYEHARARVQKFIGAAHSDEIIFTKNATEGINLVMRSWALANLQPGDGIALSIAEHHANIVPWLQVAEAEMGIEIIWIDLLEDGSLDTEHLFHVLEQGKIKLVSLTGQSNVLGTQFPLQDIIVKAHENGARVLIDAAQLVAHAPIAVQHLGCDFLAFSGHKMYGPTGIGVLYASREMQQDMPPFLGGGGMVHSVTRDGFAPADSPAKFEAGTPPIIEAIGLAAAIDWQQQFTWKDRMAHDYELITTAINDLSTIDGLRILAPRSHVLRGEVGSLPQGLLSFTIPGIHPHDLTDILGQKGFALRAGHHCAQPLHDFLNIPASTRLSFGLYNTVEEIHALIPAINEAITLLRA